MLRISMGQQLSCVLLELVMKEFVHYYLTAELR